MANRRPYFGGLACLQCESRLRPSATGRRFARLAPASSSSFVARPSPGPSAVPVGARGFSASGHLHGSGISLGTQAEALAGSGIDGGKGGKSSKRGKGGKGGVKRRGKHPPPSPDVVVDEVRLDDDIVDEPLLDERVSQAAAEEIWTSLLGNADEPTESDIAQYIDELRPVDDKILPRSVYDDLAQRLSEGFTTAQLLAYVRRHRKTTTPPTVYAWEERRRPWVPDTPLAGGGHHHMRSSRTDDEHENRIVDTATATAATKIKAIGPGSALLLQGYIHASMTNKDKIVAQLLRECWGVAVSEVMEAPGELVVAVRPLEYALLARGAQSWLRDISTAFSTVTTTKATASKSSSRSTSKGQSRQNRRIELSAMKRLLRIVAPASVADAMMAEIDRVLQTTVTKRFRVGDVVRPDATVSAEALRAVGALTGSWVRFEGDDSSSSSSSSSKEETQGDVLVSWVTHARPSGNASDIQDTDVEDTGDVVFRLLRNTFGPVAPAAAAAAATAETTGTLDYRPLKKSKGRFLATEFNNSIHRAKLGWYDRLSKWARWIEPMPEARANMEARATTTVPSPRALPFNFTLDAAPAATSSSTNTKWYEAPPQTSTVAVLGRVLHQQDHHKAKAPVYGADGTVPPQEPALRVPDVRRVLSAVTPPLLGMDGVMAVEGAAGAAIVPSTRVVLRLVPDAVRAPSLEIVLDATDNGAATPVLAAVRVITATSVCDTLFPTQAVDVRTIQHKFYELPGTDASMTTKSGPLAPLLAFLEQSQLRLSAGKFIATPLRLRGLGLPRAVLLPLADEAQEEIADKDDKADKDELVYMDYLFAEAEVRRRVATGFQGWTLGLTNVQTGLGQGQWTELSLEAVPAGPADSDAHTPDNFRQAVGDLVHGKTIQWQMPIGAVLC